MNKHTRPALSCDLSNYCHLADKTSIMEFCEWSNGEGFDVCINEKHFSLTWGEFSCLIYLAHCKG